MPRTTRTEGHFGPAAAGPYIAIALLFVTIAALASWLPAPRAARLNPVAALRDD